MNNPEEMSKGMTTNLPLWSYQLQQNSKLAVRTRKDLEVHLITRALKDDGFKQELLANPKAVVEQELGMKLPEELEINVLEETEDTVYMVLPCNPYEGMSEEELQASLGMTYEDVAYWVLEQQRNALLDEASSMKVILRIWQDERFKQELLHNPKTMIEKEWGMYLTADIELFVFEETLKKLYLILPRITKTIHMSGIVNDQGLDLDSLSWLEEANVANAFILQVAGYSQCTQGSITSCSIS